MAIVTFMSDYGRQDHYVAAVKAAILSVDPSINIVDLSHEIASFDISHAAYVLKSVFRSFPKGTIHLVSVDPVSKEAPRYLALELEDHYFVGNDSGLFSLISEKPAAALVQIDANGRSPFPCKEVLAPVATQLAMGQSIQSLGTPLSSMETRIGRQLKANKREIVGHVIRVDHYGNLITNVRQEDFEAILKLNGSTNYLVHVGREEFDTIHHLYHEVDSGNCFLLFNSLGLLQIGINKGNASELLGLKLDTPIVIEFK